MALAVLFPIACDDDASSDPSEGMASGDESSGGPDSTTGATTGATTDASASGPATSDPTTGPSTDPTGPAETSGSETGSEEGPIPGDGWLEVGYGLDAFFPFEGELPLTFGPQGFMMFSLPLRGGGFPVPPDPYDFDHPDTPVLSVWADIEGIEGEHPSGHFAAYLNYPVPFAPSEAEGVEYEFVSVWLVVPETYSPADLAGREAVVHAELSCSDGQLLVDEHTLTVIDATEGTGKG